MTPTEKATPETERIPLAEVRDLLQIGHPLPFRVLDPHERLLLNAGHRLSSDSQYEALIERGAWAERQLVEAERAAREAAGVASAVPSALPASVFDRWEKLLWQFDRLSRGLVRKEVKGAAVAPLLAALVAQVDRDPDVALFMCVRQDDRRFALYAQTHSLHCAIVGLLAGRMLGWSPAQLQTLGCAALTMNISIMELQAVLAEQDDPPTTRQRERIRAHPEASVELLRESGVQDAEWLDIVAQHHEQPGGGGYPHGLMQISDSARLLRAVDIYMAKISPRAKRPAIAPQTAMRQQFQGASGDPLSMAMIKAVGIHPPGSMVQLQSGEVAVVTRRPLTGTHPRVATLSDRQGRPSPETHQRDTAQPGYAVQAPVLDNALFPRVLPERVYGLITA
jgi:HD-GYP domain-containing protein (c-di-GMP phosphodiesterase class II)